MTRDRSTLGAPLGVDGPWLAAILATLDEIADLLTKRLPEGAAVDRPNNPNEVLLGAAAAAQPTEPVEAATTAEPVKISEPAPDVAPLPDPPPRAGRGSSVEAWARWATRAGVAVPDGATRNDIVAACVEAGVIPAETEQ